MASLLRLTPLGIMMICAWRAGGVRPAVELDQSFDVHGSMTEPAERWPQMNESFHFSLASAVEIASKGGSGANPCLEAWLSAGATGLTPDDIRYTVKEDGGCACECHGQRCFVCSTGIPSVEANGRKTCLVTSTSKTSISLPPVQCADDEESVEMDGQLVCQMRENVCPPFEEPEQAKSYVEYRRVGDSGNKCLCRRQAFCTEANGVLTQGVGGWFCPSRTGEVQEITKHASTCLSPATPTESGGCSLATDCLPSIAVPPEIACGPREPQNLPGFFRRLRPLLAEANSRLRSCLVTCETIFSKMDECSTHGQTCAGIADKQRVLKSNVQKVHGKVQVKQGRPRPCTVMYHSNMALTSAYQNAFVGFVEDVLAHQGKDLKIAYRRSGREELASVEHAFTTNVFGEITCGSDGKSGWCPNAFSGRSGDEVWNVDTCQERCREAQGSLMQAQDKDTSLINRTGIRDSVGRDSGAVFEGARHQRGHGTVESAGSETFGVFGNSSVRNTEDRRPTVCADKYTTQKVKGRRHRDSCICACVGADCKRCPSGYVDIDDECVKYENEASVAYVDTPLGVVCPPGWTTDERADGQLLCVVHGQCGKTSPQTLGDYARLSRAEPVGSCGCAYQVVCNTGALVKLPEGGWACRDTSQSTSVVERERIPKPCAGLEAGEVLDAESGECYVNVACPPEVQLRLGPLACGPRFPEYTQKFLPEAVHAMISYPSKSECMGRCWSIHAKVAECVNNDLSQYDCTGLAASGAGKATDVFSTSRGMMKSYFGSGKAAEFRYHQKADHIKQSWPGVPAEYTDAVTTLTAGEATMIDHRAVSQWALHISQGKGACRSLFSSSATRTAGAMQATANAALNMIKSEADFQMQVIKVEGVSKDLKHVAVEDVFSFSCDGDCKFVIEKGMRSPDVSSCIAQCLR